MKTFLNLLLAATVIEAAQPLLDQESRLPKKEVLAAQDARMTWWREARFGMFIHWGLYTEAAGRWEGKPVPGLSSWLLNTTKASLDKYSRLKERFNPVRFDATKLVQIAKVAGVKYIVITSKHHEGFCLFDSQHTAYDVMSTPLHRDVVKELSEACRREGVRLGFYYSILDWHHPDYLPRRPGDDRPVEGAEFDRYVGYMKNQLRELLTNYGRIDLLWFDGEWDSSWTHPRGLDLFHYVRSLQPAILINNRVDKGRQGMEGMTKSPDYAGDFGTPEQLIPPVGLPGVDWETCMTMNDTWGYKMDDKNWKSSVTLTRMLIDAASKGGNFLLNVGPQPDGMIPEASVVRLREIGQWMAINGESIYGTQASPFTNGLSWGVATQRLLPGGGTRYYLHVYQWPDNGKLTVPHLPSPVRRAYLLADPKKSTLQLETHKTATIFAVPRVVPESAATVVVVETADKSEIEKPRIPRE